MRRSVREARAGPTGIEVTSLHQASDPTAAVADAQAVFVGGGNAFRLLPAPHHAGRAGAAAAGGAGGSPVCPVPVISRNFTRATSRSWRACTIHQNPVLYWALAIAYPPAACAWAKRVTCLTEWPSLYTVVCTSVTVAVMSPPPSSCALTAKYNALGSFRWLAVNGNATPSHSGPYPPGTSTVLLSEPYWTLGYPVPVTV